MAKAEPLPTMDAKGWRRLAETVAFHMGQLAHDLAMLERESEPGTAGECKPGQDGSLCGCDDEDDTRSIWPLQLPPQTAAGDCRRARCDC